MKRSRNIRYAEVAINQTDLELIEASDLAQVVCVIIRRVTGSAIDKITLKDGSGTTKLDLTTDQAKDEVYTLPVPMKFLGLKVTTTSQCHAWVGITAETNKGVHPDRQ